MLYISKQHLHLSSYNVQGAGAAIGQGHGPRQASYHAAGPFARGHSTATCSLGRSLSFTCYGFATSSCCPGTVLCHVNSTRHAIKTKQLECSLVIGTVVCTSGDAHTIIYTQVHLRAVGQSPACLCLHSMQCSRKQNCSCQITA